MDLMNEKIDISILLVDDDSTTIFIHTKIIQSIMDYNFTIIESNQGKDALDILQQISVSGNKLPDLILLDVDMPTMNGFDFLIEFRKIDVYHTCEIIIVTSSDSQNEKAKAKALGVKYFFTKPLGNLKLKEAILDLVNP
jgi:CheY-like chemotaxis protein